MSVRILMLVLLLSLGCAEQRPVGPAPEAGISPELSPPEDGSLPANLFPHPEDWSTPSRHGGWVVSYGSAVCLKCHTTSPENPAPTCASCHPLFPHPGDWIKPEQHGASVLKTGSGSCATQCHGTDFKGGLTKLACNDCHSIYPHPPGWATPSSHGMTVMQSGATLCAGCHGQNLNGGESGVGCRQCHTLYPHEPNWKEVQRHGAAVHQNGLGSCATECHGTDLQGGLSQVACQSCHTVYPHPTAWRTFEGHGQYTLLHSKSECQLCHGTDFRGGVTGPSCFNCHAPYPHLTGWREPVGRSQGHGEFVQINTAATCATARCHGVNLVPTPGITQGINCNACHTTYPHPANWRSGQIHGPLARTDIALCKSCHGSGLDQAPPGFLSCKDCHASYLQHRTAALAPTAWETYEGHGLYTRTPTNNYNTAECQLCHGTSYSGGISNRSCRTCHPAYPHDASNWRTGGGHGSYLQLTLSNDRSSCQLCHGSDDLGGRSGTSCYECHEDYPHPAGEIWRLGTQHGTSFSNRFTSNSAEASCWDCHNPPASFSADSTRSGLESQSDCYQCHFAYPHTAFQEGASYLWEPVNTNSCGTRSPSNLGHVLYLLAGTNEAGNPAAPPLTLFADSAGNRPILGVTPVTDPLWGNAVSHSCGDSGSCHDNAARAYRTSQVLPPCGECHNNPARPYPPELPDCDPPGALAVPGAPSVTSTTPAAGTIGVAVTAPITIRFSEPMRRATVTQSGAVSLNKVSDGSLVAARISCSTDWCRTATLTPENSLQITTVYRIRVRRTVTDWDGTPLSSEYQSTFTTLTPDITPPTVLSTNPTSGATGVLMTTSTLTVTFSERMSLASLAAFTLTSLDGRIHVSGTISCDTSCQTMTFRLATPRPGSEYLEANTTYRGRLPTTVRDAAGNRLASEYSWTFTVEDF